MPEATTVGDPVAPSGGTPAAVVALDSAAVLVCVVCLTQLSRLLRRVEAGEEVVTRRGRQPVAMLVRVPARTDRRQIWGDLPGSMSEDFDELPEDFRPYV
jgi:antitoxin (DNA-binding transcriptional repressor) of toxin-antitoxin stability system